MIKLQDKIQGAPSQAYTLALEPDIVGKNTGMRGWASILRDLKYQVNKFSLRWGATEEFNARE